MYDAFGVERDEEVAKVMGLKPIANFARGAANAVKGKPAGMGPSTLAGSRGTAMGTQARGLAGATSNKIKNAAATGIVSAAAHPGRTAAGVIGGTALAGAGAGYAIKKSADPFEVSKAWKKEYQNGALAAGGGLATAGGAMAGVHGANQLIEGLSVPFKTDAYRLKLAGKKNLVRAGAFIGAGGLLGAAARHHTAKPESHAVKKSAHDMFVGEKRPKRWGYEKGPEGRSARWKASKVASRESALFSPRGTNRKKNWAVHGANVGAGTAIGAPVGAAVGALAGRKFGVGPKTGAFIGAASGAEVGANAGGYNALRVVGNRSGNKAREAAIATGHARAPRKGEKVSMFGTLKKK